MRVCSTCTVQKPEERFPPVAHNSEPVESCFACLRKAHLGFTIYGLTIDQIPAAMHRLKNDVEKEEGLMADQNVSLARPVSETYVAHPPNDLQQFALLQPKQTRDLAHNFRDKLSKLYTFESHQIKQKKQSVIYTFLCHRRVRIKKLQSQDKKPQMPSKHKRTYSSLQHEIYSASTSSCLGILSIEFDFQGGAVVVKHSHIHHTFKPLNRPNKNWLFEYFQTSPHAKSQNIGEMYKDLLKMGPVTRRQVAYAFKKFTDLQLYK